MKNAFGIELPKNGGEVFTYIDRHRHMTFATCMMNELIDKFPEVAAYMKMSVALKSFDEDDFRKNKGIEQDRVDRLSGKYLQRPILAFIHENGHSINIIDGHHRIIKFMNMGAQAIEAYVFPPVVWKEFLVDVPNALERLNEPSGMLEHEAKKQA